MTEYAIRKLEAIDFHLLIPLMQDCFGEHVNTNYFKWKFLDNPSGEFVGFIAVHKSGDVGAYYGVIPEKYIVAGDESTIYQSCDTMTHSAHRRRGLFQKLANHCYDFLRAKGDLRIIGFGGAQSTPGLIKFGWRKLFYIRYYFFPRIFLCGRERKIGADVVELASCDLIESVIRKSNSHSQIHSDKVLTIYTWRLKNPRYAYKIIATRYGDVCRSYLVYYFNASKIILFDFHFESFEDGLRLTDYVKGLLKLSGSRGIVAFCQEYSIYSKQLGGLGFIYNPLNFGPLSDKVPFTFYATQEVMDRFKVPSSWNINAFDHDAL